jgi:hypothetical protein
MDWKVKFSKPAAAASSRGDQQENPTFSQQINLIGRIGGLAHRNLRSRTSLLAQVLQIFWGKEHLVKNRLISTLDKVIYYKETFLQGSTKPLFTTQNRLETS